MKANQLATLVLRLLGIYCLVQFIPAITLSTSVAPFYLAEDHLSFSETVSVFLVVLFFSSQLIISILLIVKSVPWGEKLVPINTGETNVTTVSFEQVQVLAFAVVGALIFTGALPQLFGSLSSFLISLSQINVRFQSTGEAFYNWRTLFTSLGIILKAALGLWMFFGARGFAGFWRSFRNFGTPKPPTN